MTEQAEILLIDDDKLTLFIHEKVITRSGIPFKQRSFNNGLSALQYLQATENKSGKFILFLDINMPEMSGWELLDKLKLKAVLSNIVVIMVTSSVDEEDQVKAGEYECIADFIIKPLTINACQKIATLQEVNKLAQAENIKR